MRCRRGHALTLVPTNDTRQERKPGQSDVVGGGLIQAEEGFLWHVGVTERGADLEVGANRDEWCQPMADADRASENQAGQASNSL